MYWVYTFYSHIIHNTNMRTGVNKIVCKLGKHCIKEVSGGRTDLIGGELTAVKSGHN